MTLTLRIKKDLIVLQPFSLGDIIFSQTLINKIADGAKIIWPVESYYVGGLRRAYPNISFLDKDIFNESLFEIRDNGSFEGATTSPIRFSDTLANAEYKDVMKAKYSIYDIDFNSWKEDAMFARDLSKEIKLRKLLGINYGEEYNLINNFYLKDSTCSLNIEINNGCKNVMMKTIEGYSLFDWAEIIMSAKYIHTVSTSVLYLLEILELSAKEIHLYNRRGIESDFSFVDYLFTKNYILHL